MEIKKAATLGIVIPCYNEEEVLPITAKALLRLLEELISKGLISGKSYISFVNDGSTDRTWQIIKELAVDHRIRGIKLSTNFGHQNALFAGLMRNRQLSDCTVSLDADLQDDIRAIEAMLHKYYEGYAIIYGVRKKRENDTFFKKYSAMLFYKIMKAMGVRSLYNHADFRLVDKKVLEELAKFNEINLYLRSIFPLLGFASSIVYYDRSPRAAGRTKYSLGKMISFAWKGITSFSTFPMRMMFIAGIIIFFLSILLTGWALWLVAGSKSLPGWASTVIPIFILGGLQMIGIGLLGEYIGKIYQEVKRRPRFIIEEETTLTAN